MKIVKHYYTENKAFLASIASEVEEEEKKKTEEERREESESLRKEFDQIAAQVDQQLQEHPRVLDQKKRAEFEELARQALEYAKIMNLDVEVDFDAGMSGIITFETNFLMDTLIFKKQKETLLPKLMDASEEYCISASESGKTFTIRFTFPYYQENTGIFCEN